LGITLPVIKQDGDEHIREWFGSEKAGAPEADQPNANENSPHNVEHRQGSLFTKEQL
jgi:hypothetical protein